MSETSKPGNFITQIIDKDSENGKHGGKVLTRFPPEPNGYLHIGHAKSICLNFGIAQRYQGQCNLRFDDTNPEKESVEYIESIKRDVTWLGFEWKEEPKFASDYFDALFEFACELIKKGKAYVCELNADEMREYRGTLKEPGKDSPYRDRTAEENLALFEAMRDGQFPDGEKVLRAKIDMASPNINLRDPIIYRIRHVHHHQTGDKWCVYPMYDFTHGLSDAIEGVTHSICTLEFQDHRPLYDWILETLETFHPQQIEFARLNLNYTVTSKRKLKQLVDDGHVEGWDDPRMPTISGMRRRGYTAQSIRNFCERIGVTKSDSVVDVGMLEHAVREDLDANANRAMVVLNPIKVTLTNYPEGKEEVFTVSNHPKNEDAGTREVPFSKHLFVDQADFAEVPPRKWKRMTPGSAVRLRGGYVITCDEAIKDENGNVVELLCRYDENTLGVNPEGYKPKGVIHWVSAEHALDAEVNLYDRLFNHESPDAKHEDKTFLDFINPEALTVASNAKLEPSLLNAEPGVGYQFEREGYFCRDLNAERLVFNRTVTLRDSWAKIEAKGK
ncbi:glutamine--tRNA ligase/YqeY domain fusion protein [Marinomonas mediterranea]|uniref:glutamine--tRNA ligase/YqeY domain fusion protein n=1 Tax=Marinomonas mediterranea TaxID=119864 RepID=UPI00234A764F|nr:glutamine--tRNA ligase/YqeY domain fusion protein [Marinomonas mediterranea]WCN13542.1 glutamine--tRNA ligase/YqeY domain fusion protein [Marinomonas mediterranea]